MPSFEKFHPLLTPHYRLDWPNTVPLKKLVPFYLPAAIAQLPPLINQQLHAIMQGTALHYVICLKNDTQVLGVISCDLQVMHFKLHPQAVAIDEIFNYLFKFLKINFKINEIFLIKNEIANLSTKQKALLDVALASEDLIIKIK